MVETVGLDIIEVHRINEAIRRWQDRFVKKVFTQSEIEYCNKKRRSGPSFAARFAAKEAVWKAIGLTRGHNPIWSQVEIQTNKEGEPIVILSGKAEQKARGKYIAVSLSHTSDYAAAVAISIKKK